MKCSEFVMLLGAAADLSLELRCYSRSPTR